MSLHLRRRALIGATALLLPVSTVVLVSATGGTAFAKSGPNGPTITCSFSSTITFAPPGLSASGSENTSKTDTTSTSPSTLSCGSVGGGGTIGPLNITSKATKCKGAGDPVAVCTVKGDYAYDSEAQFSSTGSASIVKSLKSLSLSLSGGTVGSLTFSIKNSGANEIVATAPCASNEVGFQITGAVKAPKSPLNYKGGTSTLTACLLGDSGPGTTGNFLNDFAGGTATIATATIDPTTSSLVLTS